MRGHEALIAMRRQGLRPAMVWIGTSPDASNLWRDWQRCSPAHARIQIDPEDRPAMLDLRWVIGLTVAIDGHDFDRVQAVADACQQHEAARVIAVHVAADQHQQHQVLTVIDSKGVHTWQQ